MTDTLRHKTVRGLLWSFVDAVATRGVQFAVGLVLARLLFPEQFGLIGMLTIFMAVIRVFLDSGFGAALIQKRNVTQTDLCSIFYFNIVVGCAAAALLWLVAPWIAAFYRQPLLAPLTRALSLTVVINAFGLVQNTLLTKAIDFKTRTKVSLVAGAASGAIGILLASLGFGVWSLVAQQIAASLVTTGFLWVISHWRPALLFSFSALRQLSAFGSRLLFSSLLNQIFDNIYLLVIGRLFSAADLGYFTRAKTLNDVPSQTLSEVTGRVTFPVFSAMQDDPVRLKKGLQKAITSLVLVNFPLMIGLALVARPLVLVLLTEKWLPSVPYLQLLCAVGLLFPLHLMNLNMLQALGRSDLFLRLEVIKKALIALNIAVTWRWGITAMVSGMIATSFLSYFLNASYNGTLIGYTIREQVLDVLPYAAVSSGMGAAVYAVRFLALPGNWPLLTVQVATGVLVYVGLCRLFRLKAFLDVAQAVEERFRAAAYGVSRAQEAK